MRFAAMGSPSDRYTYDEIDLGFVPTAPTREGQGRAQGESLRTGTENVQYR
jgi:hypothetical protein